jgi:hypothetical protein
MGVASGVATTDPAGDTGTNDADGMDEASGTDEGACGDGAIVGTVAGAGVEPHAPTSTELRTAATNNRAKA